MSSTAALLKVGDRVRDESGRLGTIRAAGPYGDDPFQVKADDGRFHSFIDEEGRGAYGGVWTPVWK